MNFYSQISFFYDEMTRFDKRIESERPVFENILKKYPARCVLDAGCGSGLHSILLAQMGIEVDGFDLSREMLDLAIRNAETNCVTPGFTKADFLNYPDYIHKLYDAVFCLGNSLVHLITLKDQRVALQNFKDSLQKDGYLCIQILNYDKILREKREILVDIEVGDRKITRSYTYKARTIDFTVTTKFAGRSSKSTTELYPMTYNELTDLLFQAGFKDLYAYGSLKLESFDSQNSENLCLFCFA